MAWPCGRIFSGLEGGQCLHRVQHMSGNIVLWDIESQVKGVNWVVNWELNIVNWLQGSREYASQQIVDQLGLGTKMAARKGPGQAQMMPPQASPGSRFIQPISECEFTINAALDELMHDAFPRLSEHRPNRCTGTAVQVSAWHA